MHVYKLLIIPLIAILFISLIAVGGFAMVSGARMQGYMMGQTAAGGSSGLSMPFGMVRCGLPGMLLMPLLCLGGLILVGGFLLLPVCMMRRSHRPMAWNRHNFKQDKEGQEHVRDWVKGHPFFGHFRQSQQCSCCPFWETGFEKETGPEKETGSDKGTNPPEEPR